MAAGIFQKLRKTGAKSRPGSSRNTQAPTKSPAQ